MDGFGILSQSMMTVNWHKLDAVIEVGLNKAIALCGELQSLVID